MISKIAWQFMFILCGRRFTRLTFLVILTCVSICLIVVLQISSWSELNKVTTTDDGQYHSIHNFGIIDVETRRARDRFKDIGVNLVQESKIHNIRSFLLNKNDNLFEGTFSNSQWSRKGGINNNIMMAVKMNDDNLNNDSPIIKGRDNHPTLHTLEPEKTKTTQESKYSNIFLIILVISKPNNVLLRQAARKTWAKDAHLYSVLVRFVVGRLEGWDDIIDREGTLHSDMIILEEPDTYETLPNKVLEGVQWAIRQSASSSPSFVMKADDDTIINLDYLVSELLAPAFNSTQIWGAICIDSPVVRDPRDKWAVSLLDFPFTSYPPYAFGGGYVMSYKCAAILLDAKDNSMDWIHLEDVYITGILARKSGVSIVSHSGFSVRTSIKATPCDFAMRKRITSVNNSEQEFFTMHEGIQDILRSGNTDAFCDVIARNKTSW